MEFIASADWQSHHLALFNINGVRFDLHFLAWLAFLVFFVFWCKSKNEKKVALVLLFWQVAYIFVAYFLDVLDCYNAVAAECKDFIVNMSEQEERSRGIRPDAISYSLVDYFTIISLKYLSPRPRRVVDPIISCLMFLVVVHLSVGTLDIDSTGAMMAYDIIWMASYYVVFIVLFLTSGKVSDKLGYFHGFTYCSFFVSPESSKRLSP